MPHRHVKTGRKFNRRKNPRTALLRGLTEQVILYERVKTTRAKAKEVKPLVEKVISIAKSKNDQVSALRQMMPYVHTANAAKKTWVELKPGYEDRTGGYVRIIPLPPRDGDGAPMALIELLKTKRTETKPAAEKTEVKKTSGKVKVTRKTAASKESK